MASHVGFERHLDALRRRNPELALRVEAADCGEIEAVEGPRGQRTLSERGVLLASAYDPRAEARRAVGTLEGEPDLLVVLGLGLAHHLEELRAQRPCPTIVWEPSAARLRAALHLRSQLADLDDPDVHWVGEVSELCNAFARLYRVGLRVHSFVHPAVRRLDAEAVHEAMRQLAQRKTALEVGAVTRVRMSHHWAWLTAQNVPSLMQTPNASGLSDAFAGLPAVVAAAGPSLDRQLAQLREVAPRVLVIAIGQSLRALRSAGIEPDFVHVIESQDAAHQLTAAGDPSLENLVVVPSVHPEMFRIPVRTRFVAYPVTNPLGQWLAGEDENSRWMAGGASVAQSAVRLAAGLGAGPILLIGQDLAFTGGRIYARDSVYDMLALRPSDDGGWVYTGVDAKAALLEPDTPVAPERAVDLVHVEGWDGRPVPTSRSYATFIDHYAAIAEQLRSFGIELINCTEGGARLPGLAQRRFADALAAHPSQARDKRSRIDEAFQSGQALDRQRLAQCLRDARTTLASVRSEVRRARARLRRFRANPPESAPLKRLRAVARSERRIRRQLTRLPWLDALVAGELQLGALRAQRATDPDLAEALEEARTLFETARAAAERAEPVLQQVAGALGERRQDGRPTRDSGRSARLDGRELRRPGGF